MTPIEEAAGKQDTSRSFSNQLTKEIPCARSMSASSPRPSPNALFRAITPRNIQQVRERINGSANERNQIPAQTVLVYKTSDGNSGKMQILKYGYDLRVKWVTYRPDGSILLQRDNFLVKGTWAYDLDHGTAIGAAPSRGADLWWESVDGTQRYLNFRNGATFSVVS